MWQRTLCNKSSPVNMEHECVTWLVPHPWAHRTTRVNHSTWPSGSREFVVTKFISSKEGYKQELTRFSQCLNAKTGFVNFWSVYQQFLYWIFMFQIVHFQKILEGQCLNKISLTAPLYILLDLRLIQIALWRAAA